MARIPAIALLASFLLGLTGTYPIEQFMRLRLRRQAHAWIRSGARGKEVVTFTFHLQNGAVSDPRFAWEEEDEFRLDDEWFDVVDRTVQGDKVTIRCVPDGRETQLVAHFAELNAHNVPADRQGVLVLAHILAQHCLPQTATEHCTRPETISRSFAEDHPGTPLDRLLIPPSPPPERAAA